jgi:hypothetical protein
MPILLNIIEDAIEDFRERQFLIVIGYEESVK